MLGSNKIKNFIYGENYHTEYLIIDKIKKNILLIFFNIYFILSYIFIFPIFLFKELRAEYLKNYLIEFNFLSIVNIILYLLIINLSYLVMYNFLIRENFLILDKNKVFNKSIYYSIIIFLIFLFILNSIFSNNFSFNHITNLIVLYIFALFFSVKSKLIKYLFLLFIIFYLTASYLYNSFSFYLLLTLAMLIIFIFFNNIRVRKIFFYGVILFTISVILFTLSSTRVLNPKNFMETTILKISDFHTINTIVSKIPNCKLPKFMDDKKSNEITKSLFENKNNLLKEINNYNFEVNRFNYHNKYSCRSVDFYKGKYIFSEFKFRLKQLILKNDNNEPIGNKYGRNVGIIKIDDELTEFSVTNIGDGYSNYGFYGVIMFGIIFSFIIFALSYLLKFIFLIPIISYLFTINLIFSKGTMADLVAINVKFLILFLFIITINKIYKSKKLI